MSAKLLSNPRRLIGASALAIAVAIGGTAGVMLTANQATAQISVTPSAPTSGFADLVEAVKPAVVSIAVEGVEKTDNTQYNFQFPDLPPNSPFRRFFDQFGDQFGQQNPHPRHFQAAGSGFIISADGYVVTNNHVVENADKVTIITDSGDEMNAKVVGTDPRTDLALVKIEDAKDMPYVEFADDEGRIGDWVVAVGNPFGLGGTVTAGIISARGRDINENSYGDFLQIDAAVNRGNSGGPDFNMKGKVVGVNTAIFSPNGGNVGIAFAIPASTAKQVINQLKNSGTVTRGFLGVSIQDVTKDIADSVGLPSNHGALVTQPTEGAPAAAAGIKSGDVITAINGDGIDNALDLSRTIGQMNPGDKVTVTIWRDGKKQDVDVTLGTLDEKALAQNDQNQPQQPEKAAPSSVGLALVPNSDGNGLLVQDVQPDSQAAAKGFAVGDVILEVNNQATNSVTDFEKAIQSVKDAGRKTALVKASRDGNVRFIGLPLEDNNQ